LLPKKLYPGGIRTRVFCSCGGYGVNCATPPGHEPQLIVGVAKFVAASKKKTLTMRILSEVSSDVVSLDLISR
jgi:hypothetical protein